MPYELFLALRYLRARRGRRVAQLTALAAVAGIALGVAALIIASALANGFRDELRDKILRGTAHVTVTRAGGASPADWRLAAERLRRLPGITSVEPTAYEGALLTGPEGAAYTVVRGVEADSKRALAGLEGTLEGGAAGDLFRPAADDSEAVPIFVGAELAERTGLRRVGEEGWLVTGAKASTPTGLAPRALRVRVAGLFRTGLYEYDGTWTYAQLPTVAKLSGETANVASGSSAGATALSVEVEDIYAAGEAAARMRAELGGAWTVVDWREANRPLFAALELERRVVALIIALIVVVAALNITTTLALVVVERRSDIAVLTTLGASARSVTAIFVIEGATVGAVGAGLGVLLGLAGVAAGNYFGLVRLPPDVYSIAAVPLHTHARDVLLAALAAFAVSLLATLYPARRAARTRPAEVLRHG